MNLVFLAFLFQILSGPQLNKVPNSEPYTTQIVAHRGAWKKSGLPQNSLAALRRAIDLKFGGSEFDVRITADDSLIVIHDPEYHGLDVESTTYEILAETPLANGERIPTLREYLREGMRDNPSTSLVLEVKPSKNGTQKGQYIAQKVVELVHQMKAAPQVVYISFDFEILLKIRQTDPKAKLQYLEGNRTPEEVKSHGVDGLDYHFSAFEKNLDYLERAKSSGLQTNAWTVNTAEKMQWLLEKRIDFITTDEPELLAEILFQHNLLAGKELVWQDEFDYEGLPDPKKWSFDTLGNAWGWGNGELQWYTSGRLENAVVSQGVLTIRAHEELMKGKAYSSARLRTKGKGDWKYGVISVRAKLPKGRGTWPAIWMLPSVEEINWPKGGEIDIMEHVGYSPEKVFSTIHTEKNNHVKRTQVGREIYLPEVTEDFHVYTLVWEENQIRSYVNGILYFTFDNLQEGESQWPFDKEFHLLLNLAIGGGLGGKEGVDNGLFPHAFEIDFVRVYQ
jgi:glycerophosphoryl diester phosphodiesterase